MSSPSLSQPSRQLTVITRRQQTQRQPRQADPKTRLRTMSGRASSRSRRSWRRSRRGHSRGAPWATKLSPTWRTNFVAASTATYFQSLLGDTSGDYLASVASWGRLVPLHQGRQVQRALPLHRRAGRPAVELQPRPVAGLRGRRVRRVCHCQLRMSPLS